MKRVVMVALAATLVLQGCTPEVLKPMKYQPAYYKDHFGNMAEVMYRKYRSEGNDDSTAIAMTNRFVGGVMLRTREKELEHLKNAYNEELIKKRRGLD